MPPTVPLNKIYGKLRRRNFLASSINHILASVSFGGVVFIAKRLVMYAVATSHGRLPLINCRHLKCTAHILGLSSNVIIFLCVLATRTRNTRLRHIQLVMHAVATSHGRLSLINCRHLKCTVIYWGCPLMSDVCLQRGQDTHVSDTSIFCSSRFRQCREKFSSINYDMLALMSTTTCWLSCRLRQAGSSVHYDMLALMSTTTCWLSYRLRHAGSRVHYDMLALVSTTTCWF